MGTVTIADVVQKIDADLAWRGANGAQMSHVILPREQAQYLRQWIIDLCKARDEMEARCEQLERERR